MLILECGKLLSVGYEKTLLLQNSANNSVADIISTFAYRVGMSQGMYSFGTAVDLFTAVINCLMVFVVDKISQRVSKNQSLAGGSFMIKDRSPSSRLFDLILFAMCAVVLVSIIAPILNIFSVSFSSYDAFTRGDATFWPVEFSLDSCP